MDLPRCFLHVPKSAGTSLHEALERALPPGSLSPRRCDTYGFVDFDEFDRLAPTSRKLIAVNAAEIDEMRRYRAVVGHFRLSTLLRVAPPASIATVLREPRARLLSLYAFARADPALATMWRPYPDERSVGTQAHRPLDDFLSEPLVCADTDNQVCRLVLDGDVRIPPLEFIRLEDAAAIGAAAIERLETLGFVDILEAGQRTWAGLASFFDVKLVSVEANITSQWSGMGRRMRITGRTLELLEQRTAADAVVYRAFLPRAGLEGSAAERFSTAAFAEQLARFGELAGRGTAEPALAWLGEELRLKDEELAQHRDWLAAIEQSVSWRVTAPLRAAKRILSRDHSERSD